MSCGEHLSRRACLVCEHLLNRNKASMLRTKPTQDWCSSSFRLGAHEAFDLSPPPLPALPAPLPGLPAQMMAPCRYDQDISIYEQIRQGYKTRKHIRQGISVHKTRYHIRQAITSSQPFLHSLEGQAHGMSAHLASHECPSCISVSRLLTERACALGMADCRVYRIYCSRIPHLLSCLHRIHCLAYTALHRPIVLPTPHCTHTLSLCCV